VTFDPFGPDLQDAAGLSLREERRSAPVFFGAVAKAAETLRNLDWFEVSGIRGHIENGAIAHYQVTLKLGFRLE